MGTRGTITELQTLYNELVNNLRVAQGHLSTESEDHPVLESIL